MEWGTHRAATLCKVLVTHRGQKLHKEQLQDWIWPDASPVAAARNLRVALSELRRCLEPDLPPRAMSRYLENGGESIGLRCDELWTDGQALRRLILTPPRLHRYHVYKKRSRSTRVLTCPMTYMLTGRKLNVNVWL